MTTALSQAVDGVDGPARASTEGELRRQAFRRRAVHAVEHMARSASLQALAHALEAATDFGAVAAALGGTAMPDAARDLDPLADAVARGAIDRSRLADAAGGLMSAEAAGQALGISRQAVDKRRRAQQLLAVRVAGDWRYPAAQIAPDGSVPPRLGGLMRACTAAGMGGWAILDFLLAADTALGNRAPLDILRDRDCDLDQVMRVLGAAETDAFG